MFDISLMEMLIVAIAALVVIGPERLPGVARQAGQWVTRMRRYVDDIKSDFSQQMDLAELKSIKSEVEDSARSLQSGLQDTLDTARSSFDSLSSSFDTRSTNYIPEGQTLDGQGTRALAAPDGAVGDAAARSSAGPDALADGQTYGQAGHDQSHRRVAYGGENPGDGTLIGEGSGAHDDWGYDSVPDVPTGHATSPDSERLPPTDWDKVYEDRRMRQRLKDRRIERELERGFKRPRFRVER